MLHVLNFFSPVKNDLKIIMFLLYLPCYYAIILLSEQ